jgi:methyl-accepting chemotaxis protein
MLIKVSKWLESKELHRQVVFISSCITTFILALILLILNIFNPEGLILLILSVIFLGSAFYFAKFIAKNLVSEYKQPFNEIKEQIEGFKEIDSESQQTIHFNSDYDGLADSIISLFDEITKLKNQNIEDRKEFDERFDEAIDLASSQQDYLSENIDLIVEVINRFANGELNVKLDENRDDEIGKLFIGFNSAIGNVRSIIQKVSAVIDQATVSSLEISSTTEQLAATASEQTEQAIDIAIAMEEMSHTTLETSENTKNTLETAKKSGTVAKSGETVVSSTVEKIQELANVVKESSKVISNLSRSSSEIGNIISVINSIAEQTNLLALNAAIEAARAGEEGRGFAVVADEVRKLAERTRLATKQISGMIEEIQVEMNSAVDIMNNGTNMVDETIHLADGAGNSLKDILKITEELINFVNQISNANSEQTVTAKEIAKNIEQISNISRESATAISGIAKSSTTLSEMNEELNEMIKFFKL